MDFYLLVIKKKWKKKPFKYFILLFLTKWLLNKTICRRIRTWILRKTLKDEEKIKGTTKLKIFLFLIMNNCQIYKIFNQSVTTKFHEIKINLYIVLILQPPNLLDWHHCLSKERWEDLWVFQFFFISLFLISKVFKTKE